MKVLKDCVILSITICDPIELEVGETLCFMFEDYKTFKSEFLNLDFDKLVSENRKSRRQVFEQYKIDFQAL